MPGRLDFEFGFGRSGQPREESDPMRLLVLGDFSGAPAAERPPLATRPTLKVDVDNLDAVMKKLRPRVTTPFGELAFQQLDDFHPDQLYARLDVFKGLRQARSTPPAVTEDVGRLLGKPSEAAPARAAAPSNPIDAFIHSIVAPHIVKDSSAETQSYVAAVDTAIAEQMRALLHSSAFQSIEAAWRGVHWLISSIDLDENLQLHLLDVSRDEITADIVASQGKLAETGLHRALVERWRNVPGGQPWSAVVTLIEFGDSDADIGLLAALGLISSQAGGPLLAGARPALLGSESGAPAGWSALRRSEAAKWIALTSPRVLLRLPYGRKSDPIDAFAFEEFAGLPVHEEFLWGNGALALAVLLGRGFSARGWEMEPGDEREIGDLPAYSYVRDGERELQACAERFVTEREIQGLIDAGLVPLASRRDSNGIVAVRFQSIADPPAAIAW